MLESLFNKVADLRPSTLLKGDSQHGFSPVNIAKFLQKTDSVAASEYTKVLCGALRDFVRFVQFKKREKHP